MGVAAQGGGRRIGHFAGRRLVRDMVTHPTGFFGLLIVMVLLAIAISAPVLAPYDDAAQDIARRLEGPSPSHPLGTDDLGRDLLSRIIIGSRVALGVAIPAVLGALLVGLVLGMVGGYLGGRVDNVLLVLIDTMLSFPAVILALALLAVLGPSLRNVMLVIVVSFVPAYARVARALVLAEKGKPYVEAERSLGAGDWRIATIHIMPNILAPLLILVAMDIPSAIAVEAGLSFLGLGVQPPTPSWGVILADGFERVRDTPWPVLWTGLALMTTTLGFTLLGEMLRDIVDPRVSEWRRWQRP